MSDAPRRSARNAGKPAPAAPVAAPAAAKRKSTGGEKEGGAAEKKAKPAPAAAAAKPAKAAPEGALKVGDKLPSFKLKLQDGKEIDTGSLKKVVIFSYPRANTSGCTQQAKLFRDEHASFASASYKVYGLSNDSPTSLESWKTKLSFPYDLISDPKRQLIKALTGSDDKTRRSHFVIDADGKLALAELSVKPVESCPAALKFVQKK